MAQKISISDQKLYLQLSKNSISVTGLHTLPIIPSNTICKSEIWNRPNQQNSSSISTYCRSFFSITLHPKIKTLNISPKKNYAKDKTEGGCVKINREQNKTKTETY